MRQIDELTRPNFENAINNVCEVLNKGLPNSHYNYTLNWDMIENLCRRLGITFEDNGTIITEKR